MNTQETNTIIAEFMGLQFSKGEYYRPLYNSGDWIPENELQYHEEWNWLMPVVKKCFQSTLEYGEVIYPLPYHKINNALLTVNREDVYTEVVEFIKYLNRKEDAMKK